MNDEQNFNPKPERELPPELEARIVAWVLGEASAFEAAELGRLCAEQPEVALFKRRIETVHELAGEAERPMSATERESLRLSAEKRAKLLAVIGAADAGNATETPTQKANDRVATFPPPRSSWSWRAPRLYFAISSLAAACIVALLILPSAKRPRPDSSATMLGSTPNVRPDPVSSNSAPAGDNTRLELVAGEAAAERAAAAKAKADAAERSANNARQLGLAEATAIAPPAPSQAAPTASSGILADAQEAANAKAGSGSLTLGLPTASAVREAQQFAQSAPTLNQAPASAAVDLRDQAPPSLRGATDAEAKPGDVVKLDAFVVQDTREGYARAIAANQMPVNLNLPADPIPGLKESVRGDLLKKTEPASSSAAVPLGTLPLKSDSIAIASGTIGGANDSTAIIRFADIPSTPTNKIVPDRTTGHYFGIGGSPESESNRRANDSFTTGILALKSAGELTFNNTNRNVANESNISLGGRADTRFGGAGGQTFNATTGAITLSSAASFQGAPVTLGGTASEASTLNAASLSGTGTGAGWGYTRATEDKAAAPRVLVSGGERLLDNSVVATTPPPPAANKDSDVVQLSAFMVASDRDSGARSRVADAARAKAAKRAAEPDLPVAHPPRAIDEALRAEVATSAQPISTFSLHVSDVSYRLAREALARRQRPDVATIRPEEFYNAFDYGDPAPAAGEPVAARIEQAAHPFLQQRDLVRVALKVPAFGRGAGQPLRLTLLLDTSGSMERDDRVASVRRAISVLASLLGPADRVTLIGFARTPRLIADQLPGNNAAQLNQLVRQLPAEGGTNLEEALKLAGERARAQFAPGAQNRIVLLTDGAANLGDADPARLSASIAALRQAGIAFDACGVGLNGLDDSVLEALTRQGDGRYYVLNSADEADARFARQLAGAFRPAARDVKVQVRFNPARVRAYRLIGFEQHRLRAEDFRNDAIDAAELAAEEAASALYQIEALPEGEGDLGEVFVRFRRADTGEMVERSWPLLYTAQPAAFARATASLQLAGTAALLAEKLRGGAPAAAIRLDELAPIVNGLRRSYAQDPRVRQFVDMFNQARRVVGD